MERDAASTVSGPGGCRCGARVLYFRGFTGPFAYPPQTDESCVHDPTNAGRRLASRAIVWQVGATALAALAFLAYDATSALAAALGGGAVATGTGAAAWLSYRGGVQPATVVLVRWFAGVAVRWIVVLGGVLFGLAVWRLPALPLLAGVALALAAQGLVALRR